jgi:hypothetical protein
MEITKNRIKEFLDARAGLPEFEGSSYMVRFIIARGWLQTQLNELKMNINPPVLDNMIKNKRNLNVKESVLISEIFGLKPFEILQDFGGQIYKEQKAIAKKGYTNPLIK